MSPVWPPHGEVQAPVAERPDGAENPGGAVTRAPSELPPSMARRRDWAETLLSFSLELSLEDKPHEMVERLVETVAGLLPGAAVGVTLRARPDRPPYLARKKPAGCRWDATPHPRRMFGGAPRERIVELSEGSSGSTLHVATDDGADAAQAVLVDSVMQHASRLLSVCLARARAYRRARRGSADLNRLQPHLIQTEKLASLGQLVAGVVHELNNPVTSIIAYADYLRRRAQYGEQSPKDLEYFARISEAANRILRFARELTTYSRPASGSPEPIPITVPLEKALLFCEHEFERRGANVLRRFDPELPDVYGVKDQLTQVFVNLFTNAAQAMKDEGGTIEVTAESARRGSEIIVRVCDDGVGIAEPALERIFDPFFTTKADGRGTGLGLSIVQDIVKAHGGTIEAERRNTGGSQFTLRLPTVNPEAPSDSVPPPADSEEG